VIQHEHSAENANIIAALWGKTPKLFDLMIDKWRSMSAQRILWASPTWIKRSCAPKWLVSFLRVHSGATDPRIDLLRFGIGFDITRCARNRKTT
jgi:hypothetical protein